MPDFESDLDNGGANFPYCNIHYDVNQNIDDYGPIANDIAVTGYTPFFQSTWSYGARASGNTGNAVALADLDGDGNQDVAALGDDDFDDDGATIAIHRGNGDGTFAVYERFTARGYISIGGDEQVIAVGDFDRNGRPDLVTVGGYDKWASLPLVPESSAMSLGFVSLATLSVLATWRRRD